MSKFTSENQPKNRKGRGKSERTKFLEALKAKGYSEEDFYQHLIEKAMDEDSPIAMSEILKRVSPIVKAVAPTINFELDKTGTPVQKASQILDAISEGEIPPDIGVTLVTAIKSFVDIEETTELKERLEKLEEMINGGFSK